MADADRYRKGFTADGPDSPPDRGVPISATEHKLIGDLNRAIARAWISAGSDDERNTALRYYWQLLGTGSGRRRAFEITNHRIFRGSGYVLVPYSANGRVMIHRVTEDGDEVIRDASLPPGTLLTDRFIQELAGCDDEVIDLWVEMHRLRREEMPSLHLMRLRDLAALLEYLNTCGSQHVVIYLLRNLVVQLYASTRHRIAGAKNLMTEVTRVRKALNRFLNGPFSVDLRLSARILVRRISGLVAQPKLIDQVWQDTIDLSEVHVRGSAITNEIRRRAHHELGRNALLLTRAYLEWLETGEARFPDPARDIPREADDAARGNETVLALVQRIVENLDRILGSAQLAERLDEWREDYAAELMHCESSGSLQRELDALLREARPNGNRWIYLQHLRNLAARARAGNWDPDAAHRYAHSIMALQASLPDEDGFDAAGAKRAARRAVGEFRSRLLHDHQDALFEELDILVDCFHQRHYFETFERCCRLRQKLEQIAGDGVFESQRYLLHQLDCMLEELGYVALRQTASDYEEHGLDLPQCLKIISLCAGNLERDGVASRLILDLSVMLVNRIRTPSELLDVLEHVQRHYHRLVHRVNEGYGVMAQKQGFDESEVRTMLNNCQRELHDLNSLIHFADLARAHVAKHAGALAARQSTMRGEAPWDWVHLSHSDDIRRRVESRGNTSLQGRYGGKGSGLIYIAYMGMPTRDAFIIPTVLPRLELHRREQERMEFELLRHTRILEEDIRRNEGRNIRLGDPQRPLLLAVRGGSVFSMPGMLVTVVFVGMTRAVCEQLAEEDEWFAWDAFRRFLVTFAIAVWDYDLEKLELVENIKRRHGVPFKTELPASAMREIVESSIKALREAGFGETLDDVLNDAEVQLKLSVQAVIRSWNSERARRYREVKDLSEGWHTGVIVQQMASGNRSNKEELRPGMDEMGISLTGVIPHTRMTDAGLREFTGDVKFSACGDDLVGGMSIHASHEPVTQLHTLAPMLERKLGRISYRLRHFLGSDVEIEFTVEHGVLSVLQTRTALLEPHGTKQTFSAPGEPIGGGIGIRGGAFRGLVAFNEEDARALAQRAFETDDVDGVLLLLENPVPDEIPLILAVDGLLASKGGSTSHAAVAVHGIDERPYTAVLGVKELRVENRRAMLLDGDGAVKHTFTCGDVLSIHGQTGEVFAGSLPVIGVNE